MAAKKGNKYAEGNKGGRPRAIALEELTATGETMLAWFSEHQTNLKEWKRIPFFSRFAREVTKCSEDTLINYAKEDKEFLVAYKQCKQIQKEILIEGGLNGMFNATAYIFTAKNITEMRDNKDDDKKKKGVFDPVKDLAEYQ